MEGHAGTYVFVVLVAALKVLHMCCEVRVDDAETGVVENKPHCHTSFVSLHESQTAQCHFGIYILLYTLVSCRQIQSGKQVNASCMKHV